ncbi:MAG: hypothetical protein N2036_04835 [Bryobacteraceae bacterium]|nr:hypothetical protein [Bryobacteraceae bacterium]MCX7603385.1 hypothetical protein [Bryobacteraceae bacterium]
MNLFRHAILLAACMAAPLLQGQVIEFESGGLRYQTLTREGLTVMFAPLPAQIRNYVILQVAIANGSDGVRLVRPEDFRFIREDGRVLQAVPPRRVVQTFLERSGRNDVIRMVTLYEMGLYGMTRIRSTNGYEQRRQQALAEVSSPRLKAAAAASAIVLVAVKLQPGESTDGAIFFEAPEKKLGDGRLVATIGQEVFEFRIGGLQHPGELIRRP